MWKKGTVRVNENTYDYEMKVYGEPSCFGIENGKISKLRLTLNGETVCHFDRWLGIVPTTEEAKLALEMLIKEYN